jgi:aminopeptidase C
MGTNDKYLNFITGLKSSNITSNITSLRTSSELIISYLEQIKKHLDIDLLNRSINVIKKIPEEQIDTDELVNLYIKFGDIFKSILPELKSKNENIEHLNKIAIQYLNVAKQTKDTRIKNIAIAIARELSPENND